MSDTVQNPISELQVSGHTMALDPGTYCVFSAPGSALPSPDNGLPAVRVSAGPGPAAGQVEVTGLDSQGWIGPSAATLVRVAGARSTVLVTVYQAKGSKADAPQLQVVRISGEAGAAQAAVGSPVTPPAASPPVQQAAGRKPREVTVVAHIYGHGDVGGSIGEWMGEAGSKRWIEGFGLAPVGIVPTEDIEYQAVLGRGWLSPWSQGGQFCGSRSMSLPILGLRVRLRGESVKTHRVTLEATFIDGTSVGPVGDGEPCEAESLAALESFRVAIDPIGAPAAKPVAKPDAKAKSAAKTKPAPVAKAAPAPVEVAPPKRAKAVKTAAAAPPPPAPAPKSKGKSAVAPAPKRRG